jgi:uncharacterized caspase-like protein
VNLRATCVVLVLTLVQAAQAQPQAQPPSNSQPQPRMRSVAVTETRLALVIGNAAYRTDPLDNPVNDARAIGAALRQAGFAVEQHENLDRSALLEALRRFGGRLNENTVAVMYYAGHGLQLRDRNYLIPVDAEIRSEDEIPIAGIDLGFVLGRMSHARSRVNIVILDACRNNPFIGKSGPAAQGLAPMDAPVGTLLAFATAPGKLAADAGAGSASSANSIYASHLARQLLAPGLPVEQVFKRVREGVVRDTQAQQVPWESSSLQGEFAFVPAAAAAPATAGADVEAAGELAFWNSIQQAQRPDEYRAYLRQYPQGRFAALARTRMESLEPPASGAPTRAGATMPRSGDTWRYKVQDQFRIGDLYVTARVDAVDDKGVSETWTTTSDGRLRTAFVPMEPAFTELPGSALMAPEFAPYLQAAQPLRAGQRLPDFTRRVEQVTVPLAARIESEEEVVVGAGRFRALKLVLRGQAASRSGGTQKVSVEHAVWYAPAVRRPVKATVSVTVGGALREATSMELMEYRLQ